MRAGAGSGKKRMASQSPARKVRTPSSIIRDIQARAIAEKEAEEQHAKGKTKPTSLNFGASKQKEVRRVWNLVCTSGTWRFNSIPDFFFIALVLYFLQTGRAPIYVTRFVISCEQICSRSAELLAAYHKEMTKLLPLISADWERIRSAMDKVLTKRVVDRVSQDCARSCDVLSVLVHRFSWVHFVRSKPKWSVSVRTALRAMATSTNPLAHPCYQNAPDARQRNRISSPSAPSASNTNRTRSHSCRTWTGVRRKSSSRNWMISTRQP